MAVDFTVRVEGLKDLRRDLKAIDRKTLGEFRTALKEGAELVRQSAVVPHKSGDLEASLKTGTSGANALVRSRLVYANVIHWGGQVPSKRSTSTRPKRTFPRRAFLVDSLERRQDDVLETLADAFEQLTARHGFK